MSIKEEFLIQDWVGRFPAGKKRNLAMANWWLSKLSSELKDLSEQVEREIKFLNGMGEGKDGKKLVEGIQAGLIKAQELIANKINK